MTPSPRLRPFALAGLFLASVVAGCSQQPPKEEEKPVAPVHVAALKRAKLSERTELLGTTVPLPGRVAQVSAPVSGQVVEVLVGPDKSVKEGATVKASDPIVRLDASIASANVKKAEAALADLEEQQKQAKFAVELAEIEVKRLEELGATAGTTPLISKVELEKARVVKKDAQSKLDGMLARQKSARAEVASLKAQFDYYTLKAPISGHLGLVQASPGQTLAAGTVVAEIVDLDKIDVLCHAPPRVARELELGREAHLVRFPNKDAKLRAAADPKTKKDVVGHVVYIAVQAQAETGNFDVKVRFPNKDAKLRANAVVRVEVVTKPGKEECWAIDARAVIEDQEPPQVVLADDPHTKKDEDGKVKKDEHGKEEQFAKPLRLSAILGVHDRKQGLIQIIRLETEKKEKGPELKEGLLFVIEGAHGLEGEEELKIEE
jgi:RND family efflux transporter MFP subunit